MSKVDRKKDALVFLTVFEYLFLILMLCSCIFMFEYVFDTYYYKFLDSTTVIYELLDMFLGYSKKPIEQTYNMFFINNFNIIGGFSFGLWFVINIAKFILMCGRVSIAFSVSVLVLMTAFCYYIHSFLGWWMICVFVMVPMVYSYKINEYEINKQMKGKIL